MSQIQVTTDLIQEPWQDIQDPPFGTVERMGLLAPSTVAMLIRMEDGSYTVGVVELGLYVKASTALMRAAVENGTPKP